ncbi:YdcF family protein [Actinomyces minihominis]|uniref:YdcF family protein n=1 Tax=Actinomyces minihominis TaxID=2002838 RepID=UPI00101AD2DC|nr:YdcF family protein [Actinomyces minihominis]
MLAVYTLVVTLRNPRRMRAAVGLGLTLFSLVMGLVPLLFSVSGVISEETAPWVLLAFLVVAALTVLGVAVFLIWAGVVLLIREGLSVSHSLSLAVGAGILGYLALGLIAVFGNNRALEVDLMLLVLPIFFFGFTLFSYLLYSGIYGVWARRWARPGEVVVVLGSGLIGDRVPPLLARRLDLGLEMYRKSLRKWQAPLLVVSGGKGSDEVVAEGEAMGRYVLDSGLPEVAGGGVAELVVENRSASTEENLEFTSELIAARGVNGPWMVVSSDFHAFRAALLMSQQGLPGNAVGARSVRYFWASAKLREFIAILAMFPKWTVTFTVLSALPFAVSIFFRLLALIG